MTQKFNYRVGTAALLTLILQTACASGPPPKGIYGDGSTSVQLWQDTRTSQEHNHPSSLSVDQVKAILTGVRLAPRRDPVAGLIMGNPAGVPVFTSNDVVMLAKPVSMALAAASPKEIVTFWRRVSYGGGSEIYTTGGLFVQDGHVYLIIANHRAGTEATLVRDTPIYPIDPTEDPLMPAGSRQFSLQFARPEAEVHPQELTWSYDHSKILVIDPMLAMRSRKDSGGPASTKK
ncbi:hypothetical protein YTPLAS18_20120 [Nitrospira sp.]|nr:hypothetical protein YTPLAS18_20120 [Nitrospira sp.]